MSAATSAAMIAIDLSRIVTAADKAAEAAAAAAASRKLAARAYLAETDWYVTRFAETGTAIPDAVSDARKAARSDLN